MPKQLIQTDFATPVGDLTIVCDGELVVICEFSDKKERVRQQLHRFYSGVLLISGPLPSNYKDTLTAYFGGALDSLNTIQTAPLGTQYEQGVWAALRAIPAGNTTSYGALAQKIGSSPRAVGRANGRNPIALIHPCHRVIGADGSLTGYAGGLHRKEWLLQHERALLPL